MQRDTRHPLDLLFGHLSRDERQEVIDIIDYLAERSMQDGGGIPEGSMQAVLAQASPRVAQGLAVLLESLDVPRMEPFVRKMEMGDKARALGFDPAILEAAKGRLDQEAVTAGVQQRLGTDRDLQQEPPSRREQIAAALDQYQQGE